MRLERFLLRHLPTILGVGVGVLVLNMVIYVTAVSRLDRFARSLKAEVNSTQGQIVALTTKDKSTTKGVDNIKGNRRVVDDLAGKILLTKGQRLVEVQKALTAMAEAHHLQLDNIGYGYSVYPAESKMTWDHRFLKVDIQVPVSGPYQDLKGFLKDIQGNEQFLSIKALSLAASAQGSALIQTNLSLSTYFVATEQDLKDLATMEKRS